jgi:hypothetical protein
MAESVEQALRVLTGMTGDTAAQVYAKWAAVGPADASLEQLVRLKLVATGKSAQLRESLEATLRAGGAVGESVEQMLAKSGLTGWS